MTGHLSITHRSITHRNIAHNDFSLPLTIKTEAQVIVSHQLRALLLDLVKKRMNTCNKPSTSFYRKYAVRQMTFSTHCIVLKMTHDMRGLTYFLVCEVNITPFFLLASSWVLPLRGMDSHK